MKICTGFDASSLFFSRMPPSGKLSTMNAVSWVLPPTRTCTAPAFSTMRAIKLRKGTLSLVLSRFQPLVQVMIEDTHEFFPTLQSRQLMSEMAIRAIDRVLTKLCRN